MTQVTDAQKQAAMEMFLEVATAIQRLKGVSEGELYNNIQNHFSLHSFNMMMDMMKKAGFIKIENHWITWIGPDAKITTEAKTG